MAFHTFRQTDHTPSSHRPMGDINVTPLVDVMLVLLVIFMVTAPLMVSSINLSLPQSAAARPAEPVRSIRLVVEATGQVRVNDHPLDSEALLERLRAEARASTDTEVQLQADRQVPYGRVVELIGLAQQAGLSRVGFVAEPLAGSGRGAP